MGSFDAYRRLTLFLSCSVIVSHLAAVHVYRHLPDDPLHIAWHLSLYSYFAAGLGVIGFFGARKSNATLVSIFSNYLLIDILISAIPKLAAVTFFGPLKASICSTENIHAWIESQTESSAIAQDPTVRMHMMCRCRRVVGVLQVLTTLSVIAFTIFQVCLVLRVNAYARNLCIQEDEMEEERKGLLVQTKDEEPVNEKSGAYAV